MEKRRVTARVDEQTYVRLEKIARAAGYSGTGRMAGDLLRLAADASEARTRAPMPEGDSETINGIFEEMMEWQRDPSRIYRIGIKERNG